MIDIQFAAEVTLAHLRRRNAKISEEDIIAEAKSLGFNQEESEDIAELVLRLK